MNPYGKAGFAMAQIQGYFKIKQIVCAYKYMCICMYMCVCVRVCVCAHACLRACVYALCANVTYPLCILARVEQSHGPASHVALFGIRSFTEAHIHTYSIH